MSHDLPAGFSFKLFFTSSHGASDVSFQEVQGFKATMECEEYKEGGENRFLYQLPKGVKNEPLVLKRGIALINSPLVVWCNLVFSLNLGARIITQPVGLYLMDELQVPIRIWTFMDAWPSGWEVDSFNSTKNEIAVEKITLNYSTLTRVL